MDLPDPVKNGSDYFFRKSRVPSLKPHSRHVTPRHVPVHTSHHVATSATWLAESTQCARQKVAWLGLGLGMGQV